MSKFKFGERVVAIRTHSTSLFIKDEVYTVDGFNCCRVCGQAGIYLKEIQIRQGTICDCRATISEINERSCFGERSFEKAISIGETTTYRLKVSIPELIKIKETQLT